MGGLARVAKLYGGLTVVKDGQRTEFAYDYVADEPVLKSEMPVGSERHKLSERMRWTGTTEPPAPLPPPQRARRSKVGLKDRESKA